jgi:hypothetical protein
VLALASCIFSFAGIVFLVLGVILHRTGSVGFLRVFRSSCLFGYFFLACGFCMFVT